MLTVFIRAILLYLLVTFSLRLMGKRQLGELQPTELVITILISNIASLPIEDPTIPMATGAIPIIVLVGFELFISQIAMKKRGFRKILSGSPVLIITNGVVDQKALKDLRFSIDDLMASLRSQGIFDIRDVQYAVVETTGTISVLQKYHAQPVTPAIMHLKGEESSMPIVIVNNGELLPEAMSHYDITEHWVQDTLKKEKQSLKEVFLMTANQQLQYYIIPKQ